jgi:hypothetical protein
MDQKGKREFLAYVGDGMSSGNWVAATNQHYGYKNLAVLQETWLEWVKQGSPARSPDVNRASGNLALASKAGPEHNVIMRAQSSDRSTRASVGGNTAANNSGETQWAPLARQAPTPQPPVAAAPVGFPVTAPIRNGSVAMDTSATNPLPATMSPPIPAPGKSVYGEGVGLIHHSADFRSDNAAEAPAAAANVAPAAESPAAESPAAGSQSPRDRKVLLEWTRQQ